MRHGAQGPSQPAHDAPPPTGADSRAGAARVLLVSALPPPAGGIQTWTEILCERGLPAPFELELVDTRVTRRHQNIPPTLNAAEAKRFLKILWQIRRSLRSRRFSLMHLNCSLTMTATPRNLLSTLVARRAGVPYVVHLRGTLSLPTGNSLTSRFYRWAYRTMFEGAASILALGQPSYRSILTLGDFADKTVPLLPNFVDGRTIPERYPSSNSRKVMKVIFTGALVESKGVHTIVEAATLVHGAQFQLVGDGPPESRQALLRHIRDRGLRERVQVLGPFTNREILHVLRDSDVFIFPTWTEGFPNSVAEAMAIGLPVVASPVGAIPEMIDADEGGYLFAHDDVEGYAKALVRLRDEPSLRTRMGEHNKRKALREYGYDTVVKRLCNVYASITRS